MQIQDKTSIRTIQQLLQAYNFDSIGKTAKALSLQKNSLTKVENETAGIIKAMIINLSDVLESQSDLSLWFFNETPTLQTTPAVAWTTQELLTSHLGDVYYDKDSGSTSIFELVDTVYDWVETNSLDLIQAMALTNAQVGSDNERKVFIDTPYTPYDSGDWYLNENGLKICQKTKAIEETYDENDFIIASRYTDDTKANEVDGKVTILSGQVATVEEKVGSITTTITEVSAISNATNTNLNNNYLTGEQVIALSKANTAELELVKLNQSSLTQTATDLQFKITSINTNGLSVLKNSLVTVDEAGVKVSKSGEEMSSLQSNTGFFVKRDTDEVLGADNSGVRAINIWAKNYLSVGKNSRIEDYQDGTGCFFTGGDV